MTVMVETAIEYIENLKVSAIMSLVVCLKVVEIKSLVVDPTRPLTAPRLSTRKRLRRT